MNRSILCLSLLLVVMTGNGQARLLDAMTGAVEKNTYTGGEL